MPKSNSKLFNYLRSFGYAVEGLHYVILNHRSFGIQVFAALVVIGLGFGVGLSRDEWLITVLTIFWILMAELLNTSVETALDHVAHEHHVNVKVAKDVAAGAVFLSSLGAVVIGLIVFAPHIMQLGIWNKVQWVIKVLF